MSRAGLVHVMQVSVLTDEHGEHVPDIEWFHPEGCAVTVSSEPDPYRGLTVHYDCPVSYNLEAAGLDAFRDGPPKEPGLYLVEAWSDTKRRHETVQMHCKAAATAILSETPEGREQSLAVTKLEEAMMWANAAIARAQK